MPLSLVFAALLAILSPLAMGADEPAGAAPAEPSPAEDPEATESEVLTVVSQGAAPHAVLRLAVQPSVTVTTAVQTMHNSIEILESDGTSSNALSALESTVQLERAIGRLPDDQMVRHHKLSVVDLKAGPSGLPPFLDPAESQIRIFAGLEQPSWSDTYAADGARIERRWIGGEEPFGFSMVARQFELVDVESVFPDVAVGPGAQWTIAGEHSLEGGGTMRDQQTVTLVRRDDHRVTLDIEGTSEQLRPATMRTPAGPGIVEDESCRWTTRVTIDLHTGQQTGVDQTENFIAYPYGDASDAQRLRTSSHTKTVVRPDAGDSAEPKAAPAPPAEAAVSGPFVALAGHGRKIPFPANAFVRTAGEVAAPDVSPDDLMVLTQPGGELQVAFVPASDEGLSEAVRATLGEGPDGPWRVLLGDLSVPLPDDTLAYMWSGDPNTRTLPIGFLGEPDSNDTLTIRGPWDAPPSSGRFLHRKMKVVWKDAESLAVTFRASGTKWRQEMWWVDVGAQTYVVVHRFEDGGPGLGDAVDAVVRGMAPR